MAMSRSTLAVSNHAIIGALIDTSSPTAHSLDEAFARIDELLDLEPPTRRSHALLRDLEASTHPADDDRPTLTVSPQESMRLLATAFATESDDVTIEARAPLPRPATMASTALRFETPAGTTMVVAGIWAMALCLMAVLAFFMTEA